MLTLFSCFPWAAQTGQTCSSCCWSGRRCWCGTRPRRRWHRCPKTCWKHCLSPDGDPALTDTAGGKGQRHGVVVTCYHRSAMDLVPPAIWTAFVTILPELLKLSSSLVQNRSYGLGSINFTLLCSPSQISSSVSTCTKFPACPKVSQSLEKTSKASQIILTTTVPPVQKEKQRD